MPYKSDEQPLCRRCGEPIAKANGKIGDKRFVTYVDQYFCCDDCAQAFAYTLAGEGWATEQYNIAFEQMTKKAAE
jgi:hypothetical protein